MTEFILFPVHRVKRRPPQQKGPQPSTSQLRWLERGLAQPGGKLPLFDEQGQYVSDRTVRSCIDKGWAAPWFENPLKPNWLVCKLTDAGRTMLAGRR